MADRTLFITGASSGIGAATARAAAGAGWRVGLFARTGEALEKLVEELGGPDRAMALPGDATRLDEQRKAVDAVVEAWGGLDAAFANAGMGISGGGAEGGDPDEWHRLIHLNVLGVLWTAKAAMAHLRARQGQFLVTGSAAGRRHIKGSVYGATKWFVHGYAGNLAEEMREWGGRCTVIAPGMVDTPFFDEPRPDKLHAEDVAASVVHALQMPPRADVREVFLMPVD